MSIASEITRLQTAKSDLKTSIENKGVTVPSATTIDGYALLVDQISAGVTLTEVANATGTTLVITSGGGGGGGSSDVETATIEITVTNGTATITSGEFPDWCTSANSDYIYGKVKLDLCITAGGSEWFGEYGIQSVKLNQQGIIGVVASAAAGLVMTKGLTPIIGTKLEFVGDYEYGPFQSGTVTVTLVYVPEE